MTLTTDNIYDGEWRPVIDPSDKALNKLRDYGFEFGADTGGRLMARWPVEPAAQALTFTGEPLAYWQEEVRLGCVASLARLRALCAERGADYAQTIARLGRVGG